MQFVQVIKSNKKLSLILKELVIMFVACLIIIGCKEESIRVEEDVVTINITNPSGTDFSYIQNEERLYYAPYPFNVGLYTKGTNTSEFIVLSKNVAKGTSLDVIPIARMTLRESSSDQTKDIYISIPKDGNLALIKDLDFSKLTVENFSLKQIVEFWYSNRYGLQGTSVKGWAPADLEDFK